MRGLVDGASALHSCGTATHATLRAARLRPLLLALAVGCGTTERTGASASPLFATDSRSGQASAREEQIDGSPREEVVDCIALASAFSDDPSASVTQHDTSDAARLSVEAALVEARLLRGARLLASAGCVKEASDLLKTHELKFPNGTLAEDRDYFLIMLRIRDEDGAAATQMAESFVRNYPKSRLRFVIDSWLRHSGARR